MTEADAPVVEGPAVALARTARSRDLAGLRILPRIEAEALSTAPDLMARIHEIASELTQSLHELDARYDVAATRDELVRRVGKPLPLAAQMLRGTLNFLMMIAAIIGATGYFARRPMDRDDLLHFTSIVMIVAAVIAVVLVALSLVSARWAQLFTPFLVTTLIASTVEGAVALGVSRLTSLAYNPEAQADGTTNGWAALVVAVCCIFLLIRARAVRRRIARRTADLQPRLREIETALAETRAAVLAELEGLSSDPRSAGALADRNAALAALGERNLLTPKQRDFLPTLPLGALQLIPEHDDLIGARFGVAPKGPDMAGSSRLSES